MKRSTMIARIHRAWYQTRSKKLMLAIWAESDGYGEQGFVPIQGYDWSGIRDSSLAAVKRMFAVVRKGGF